MKLKELYEVKKSIIYLDLDGVLADFNNSIKRYTGKYPYEMSSDEMWKKVQEDEHFYRKLEKMPDANRLFSEVSALAKEHGFVVKVLTAIPRKSTMPNAGFDKIEWVKEHFPGLEVILGPYSRDKWKHAKFGDILIDDRQSNIKEWKEKGNGIGILYKNTNDTINNLKSIL